MPRETKGLCEVLDIAFIVLTAGIFVGKSEYIEVIFYLRYRENTIRMPDLMESTQDHARTAAGWGETKAEAVVNVDHTVGTHNNNVWLLVRDKGNGTMELCNVHSAHLSALRGRSDLVKM